MELFWEVDYITPPADKETLLRNRPQKRPRAGSQFVGSTTSTCSPPTEKAFATSWWISSDFGNVNGSSRGRIDSGELFERYQSLPRYRHGARGDKDAWTTPPCLLPLHLGPAHL